MTSIDIQLEKYKQFGFLEIEGWCNPELFQTINALNNLPINKVGGCLEIGVHHGKFYILLNSVIDKKFTSIALDVFENQDLNIDFSGEGSLEIFDSNLKKFDAHKGKNTKIMKGDSLDSKLLSDLHINVGAFRFISIDGGHTAHHTLSDLKNAEKLIANEGVVILDDVLNYHWLGVIEGLTKYLESKPTLVPFAIGHNKLYLSKFSYQNYYFEEFKKLDLFTKTVEFFGHKVAGL